MDDLLRELIEYVGDDYFPEQESFLRMLLSDAMDEVLSEMYPYGFCSDKEEESVREQALKDIRAKYEKLLNIITISKDGKAFLDGLKTEQVFRMNQQGLLLVICVESFQLQRLFKRWCVSRTLPSGRWDVS